MRSFRYRRVAAALGAASLLAACGDQLITVAPAPAALHVRPLGSDTPFAPGIVVNIGETLPLEALPVTTDSTVLGGAVAARWTSSDTLILVVTADGVLHTRCVGRATVTAAATAAGHAVVGHLPVTVGSFGAVCAP